MSAKSKSPKFSDFDEISGIYMPPFADNSLERPKPYNLKISIEQRIERSLAESVSMTIAGREMNGQTTRRGDILDNDRLMPQDIENALKLGLVYEADGFFSTLPEWAKIDPNAPQTADFECAGYAIRREVEQPNDKTETEYNPLALIFDGLKLKNGERAEKDGYWFYVGSLEDCDKASLECFESYGVESTVKKNGKTACWKFIIPYWLNFSRIGDPLERLTKIEECRYSGSLRDCLFAGEIMSGLGFEARVSTANGNNILTIEN